MHNNYARMTFDLISLPCGLLLFFFLVYDRKHLFGDPRVERRFKLHVPSHDLIAGVN